MAIGRGTTPTVTYTFKVVDPADITVAYLTIKQRGNLTIEKTLETADVGEKTLKWTLTQQETLLLQDKSNAEMQLRYRLRDGSAHRTNVTVFMPEVILKDGEI